MITASLKRDSAGRWRGYSITGHAGYDRKGRDILCAAVSMLAINTANALEELAGQRLDARDKDGFLEVRLLEPPGEKAELLMNALELGLNGIRAEYGERYLRISEETEEDHA